MLFAILRKTILKYRQRLKFILSEESALRLQKYKMFWNRCTFSLQKR